MTRPPRLGNHALHLLDLGLGPSKGAELCFGGVVVSDEEATQHNTTHITKRFGRTERRDGGRKEDGYGSR